MKIAFENGEVVIRIPFNEKLVNDAPLTSTGNSRMIATTGGFARINGMSDSVKISVNMISVIPRSERVK